MPVEFSSSLESQSHDLCVTIETHDEHHMGANTVLIIPSRPIGNVSRFHTTNGDAFFTPDGNGLIIQDACVILFFDLNTGDVFNREPPETWYFTKVRIEYQSLLSQLYDGSGNRKTHAPMPLVDIKSEFTRGFGPVDGGRFPSAHP